MVSLALSRSLQCCETFFSFFFFKFDVLSANVPLKENCGCNEIHYWLLFFFLGLTDSGSSLEEFEFPAFQIDMIAVIRQQK